MILSLNCYEIFPIARWIFSTQYAFSLDTQISLHICLTESVNEAAQLEIGKIWNADNWNKLPRLFVAISSGFPRKNLDIRHVCRISHFTCCLTRARQLSCQQWPVGLYVCSSCFLSKDEHVWQASRKYFDLSSVCALSLLTASSVGVT